MKPGNKLRRQVTPFHRTYKTKDDFLRWWRAKELLKKQEADLQSRQAEHATLLALMAWADDGGPAA